MENMECTEKQIACNDEIKYYLLESSKWSKFLAVIGYIGLGFLIIFGLLMMFGIPIFSKISKGVPMFVFGLIYIIMAIVYYFPTAYLYRFARRIKLGVTSNDESIMTEGFMYQKKMFKFIGILMIVVLSIYALIIVIAVPSVLFFQ